MVSFSQLKLALKLGIQTYQILTNDNEVFLVCMLLKFINSEKVTKLCEIFTLLFSYLVPVKSKVKIWQNYVAFVEYMSFTPTSCLTLISVTPILLKRVFKTDQVLALHIKHKWRNLVYVKYLLHKLIYTNFANMKFQNSPIPYT